MSRLLLALALSGAACAQTIAVQAGGTKLIIERQPMRIAVEHDGVSTVGAYPDGGLLWETPITRSR